MDVTRFVCTCLVSVQLCPVHRKEPHVEGRPAPIPQEVFQYPAPIAAVTSSQPAGLDDDSFGAGMMMRPMSNVRVILPPFCADEEMAFPPKNS